MEAAHYPAPFHHYPSVDSTNDLARGALQRGEAGHGELFVALEQTSGRGRLGREWHSPSPNLYMSMVLQPQWESARIPQLTLSAGVAARDALEEACGVAPLLKWPNDLILSGRKLGGVLCEGVLEGDQVTGVVVGIGLNLFGESTSFPEELRDTAISVEQALGERPEVSPLVLAQQIASAILAFVEGGESGLSEARQRWESNALLPADVELPDGREGTATGIDEGGALQVELDGEVTTVSSGEVIWKSVP